MPVVNTLSHKRFSDPYQSRYNSIPLVGLQGIQANQLNNYQCQTQGDLINYQYHTRAKSLELSMLNMSTIKQTIDAKHGQQSHKLSMPNIGTNLKHGHNLVNYQWQTQARSHKLSMSNTDLSLQTINVKHRPKLAN